MSVKRRAVAGGAWIGASLVANAMIQLVQVAFLARILGQSEMGQIALVVLALSFMDILVAAGVSNAIIQREMPSRDELSSLYWLNFGIGGIAALIFGVCSPLIAAFFGMPDMVWPLVILCAGIIAASGGQVPRGVLERNHHFRPVAFSETLAAIAVFSVGVGLALAGFGVMGVVIGYIVGTLARVAYLQFAARKLFRISLHFRAAETRRFLSFGLYQGLDSLSSFFTSNAGTVVAGRVLSSVAMGGLSIATTYAINTPVRVNSVVTRVGFPALADIHRGGKRIERQVRDLVEIVGMINAPLLIILCVLSGDFIEVVLGPSWSWLVPSFQVLCLVGLTRALNNPMGAVAMAIDRIRAWFWVNLVRALLTITATYVGAVIGGVVGIAIGLLLVGIAGLAFNIAALRAVLGLSVLDGLRAHCVPVLLALPAAIFAAGISLLSRDMGLPPIVALFLSAGAGVAGYCASVLLFRRSFVRRILG